MQKRERNKFLVYIPFLFVLALLFFQYSNGFPQGDDFTFFIKGGSLPKIFAFYRYYYAVAGSRMANLFAQLLLLDGLRIWKIATPLAICGISLLLFYYIRGYIVPKGPETKERLHADFLLAAVCAVFPGLMPVSHNLYGDVFLWMDGSCNYLYPFFLMLIGFLPIYSILRNRTFPKPYRFVSPVCFCAAAFLHEQMALLIFGMCIAAVPYLIRSKQMTPYIWSLCALSILTTAFTLTCPGGYSRLHSSARPANSLGIRGVFLNNLPSYFSSIFNDCLFWVVLMGLCALYMIHKTGDGKGLLFEFFSFYLTAGVILFAMATMLKLPCVQYIDRIDSKWRLLAEIIAVIYWISFLAVCLTAMIRTANMRREYRYAVVLFAGMWSSQAIPAIVGSWGRPMLPLVLLDFLLAASLFQGLHLRYGKSAQLSVAAVGMCSMLIAAGVTMRNYRVYLDIDRQINDVHSGKSNMVVIDNRKFDLQFMYSSAFSVVYAKDIREYYSLPKNTVLIIK
ncbi:DUF6056 family protein [Caproicibacter sp.]|uniref:DUF6056 family protein n=1 Tax=Caproicibacter sp. TaxID=2814884 RepID=UPI003989EAB8